MFLGGVVSIAVVLLLSCTTVAQAQTWELVTYEFAGQMNLSPLVLDSNTANTALSMNELAEWNQVTSTFYQNFFRQQDLELDALDVVEEIQADFVAIDSSIDDTNGPSVATISFAAQISYLTTTSTSLNQDPAVILFDVFGSGESFASFVSAYRNSGIGFFQAVTTIGFRNLQVPSTVTIVDVPDTASPTTSMSPTTSSPTSQPPTISPTMVPTRKPTIQPSTSPTSNPTLFPTNAPTTTSPTMSPTGAPSATPTVSPTHAPTSTPSILPTQAPTLPPITVPPTEAPITATPTNVPTNRPTTSLPTERPTTNEPTSPAPATLAPPQLSQAPSPAPNIETDQPTAPPTNPDNIAPTPAPAQREQETTISPTNADTDGETGNRSSSQTDDVEPPNEGISGVVGGIIVVAAFVVLLTICGGIGYYYYKKRGPHHADGGFSAAASRTGLRETLTGVSFEEARTNDFEIVVPTGHQDDVSTLAGPSYLGPQDCDKTLDKEDETYADKTATDISQTWQYQELLKEAERGQLLPSVPTEQTTFSALTPENEARKETAEEASTTLDA